MLICPFNSMSAASCPISTCSIFIQFCSLFGSALSAEVMQPMLVHSLLGQSFRSLPWELACARAAAFFFLDTESTCLVLGSPPKPTCCDEQFASWRKDYIQFVLSSFSEQYEWVLIRADSEEKEGIWGTSYLCVRQNKV